jgi:putative pyruvate formate lyase activating enzyme
MLGSCELCERRCGINRLAGERAPCGLGSETWSFKRHVSFAEEIELLPSYMVYFGGCNFRCAFCVQAPVCFDPRRGERIEPGPLAREFERIVEHGARTINLLGGEPSLHLHTILDIAAEAAERGVRLPLVLNSNFYMTPEVLELLEGVVDIYLADFKFGRGACATRVAGVERYWEVVTRNLLLASEHAAKNGASVLVRHLLMPGHVDCCHAPVAEWMAANLPKAHLHVMDSYVPAWRACGHEELGRLLTDDERARARGVAAALTVSRSQEACV